MNTKLILAGSLSLALAACGGNPSGSAGNVTVTTSTSTSTSADQEGTLAKVVRQKILNGMNVNGLNVAFLDGKLILKADGQPDAAIDANGQLTVGTTAVALTAQQLELTKALHAEALKMADTAVELGKGAADVASKAASSAMKSVVGSIFSGGPTAAQEAEMEKTIEAAVASGIGPKALALCNQGNAFQDIQAKMDVAIPQYKPYYRKSERCDPADILKDLGTTASTAALP